MLAGRPCLLAVAAPLEADAVLRGLGLGARARPEPWTQVGLGDRFEMILTGVGKANAAGAVARVLAPRHAGVLSLGLAGALPGSGLEIGGVVVAEACVFADDGAATPEGFRSQADLGFPAVPGLGERLEPDARWRSVLGPLGRAGICATVSTCSGTDALAREIAGRTGAIAEDMESASVGLVASRLGVPFANLRVISNATGDRGRQGWDLRRAFAVLEALAAAL